MNAVGIRDMEAGQTLYWAVAVPTTVVVLAVAFVYGYKGDEIGDWVHEKMHRAGPGQHMQKASTPVIRARDAAARWPMDRAAVRERWDMAKESIRDRTRGRRRGEIMRRSTFQSDVFP